MVRYTRAYNDEDLHQILSLQRRNLPKILSEKEKQTEGFLTVCHEFDLLQRMNDLCPHIIAKANNKVVGYALCMHPQFKNEIEVLLSMFQELNRYPQLLNPEHCMIMGQVCVDKEYRRQGVFRKLYQKMKDDIIPPFEAIVTEVNVKNVRSKEAHSAIGFKLLSIYRDGEAEWELIYLQ